MFSLSDEPRECTTREKRKRDRHEATIKWEKETHIFLPKNTRLKSEIEKVKRLLSCSPSSGLFVTFVRQEEADCFIRSGRALGGKGRAACSFKLQPGASESLSQC